MKLFESRVENEFPMPVISAGAQQLINNHCIFACPVKPLSIADICETDEAQKQLQILQKSYPKEMASLLHHRPIVYYDAAKQENVPFWQTTPLTTKNYYHIFRTLPALFVAINQAYYDEAGAVTRWCKIENAGYCETCWHLHHKHDGLYAHHLATAVDLHASRPLCKGLCPRDSALYATLFCVECDLPLCLLCAFVTHSRFVTNVKHQGAYILNAHAVQPITWERRQQLVERVHGQDDAQHPPLHEAEDNFEPDGEGNPEAIEEEAVEEDEDEDEDEEEEEEEEEQEEEQDFDDGGDDYLSLNEDEILEQSTLNLSPFRERLPDAADTAKAHDAPPEAQPLDTAVNGDERENDDDADAANGPPPPVRSFNEESLSLWQRLDDHKPAFQSLEKQFLLNTKFQPSKANKPTFKGKKWTPHHMYSIWMSRGGYDAVMNLEAEEQKATLDAMYREYTGVNDINSPNSIASFRKGYENFLSPFETWMRAGGATQEQPLFHRSGHDLLSVAGSNAQ